jgi:hypothetical protein
MRNFFATSKEKLERHQFGGTLGGPVVIPGIYIGRGKTFFFASYEGHRRQEGTVNVSIVPTAAQRQGDFRGLAPIYDPLTTAANPAGGAAVRTQFANDVIPQARLSQQALFFNRYIPLPNQGTDTYVSNPITEFDANQITLRLDQTINPQHRLFTRFSRHVNAEDRPSAWPSLGSTRLEGPAYNIAVAWTSNLKSSMVHEFRFSRMYGEYRSTAYFQGQGVDLMREAGVTGLEGIQDPAIASLPAFSFSGYAGFSGNAGDGRPKWQDRGEYEVTDNLTWIKGKHIVKFGGRMYRLSRRALWRIGWQRELDPAAAASGHGVRSAVEFRPPARALRSDHRRVELRGRQGPESAADRADQYSGAGTGEYSGAPALSALRQRQRP